MKNVQYNDYFYTCFIIEYISRKIKQPNRYLVNKLGYDGISWILEFADILHCENKDAVAAELIEKYKLQYGTFDILAKLDKRLVDKPPRAMDMGKAYANMLYYLISSDTDISQLIIDVYNSKIAEQIDNYNGAGYYTPAAEKAYYYKNYGEFV